MEFGVCRGLDVLELAKNLEISLLYDFYGELLTEKRQEVIELYYNEDLSLDRKSTRLNSSH